MIFTRALQKWFSLALISCLSLFLELAVIRWLSAEVRLFSYLKNIPLLAAFFGLAIGFALVNKGRDYKRDFAPILAIFVILVLVIGRISSPRALAYPTTGEEFVWFAATISYWLALIVFLGVVLIFFLMTMFLFIPLGQATGEEMARHEPVPAYFVNILASLIGVWLFSIISFLQSPPVVWFGIAILGAAVYFRKRYTMSRLNWSILGLVLVAIVLFSRDAVWSPYQRLSVSDLYLPRRGDGAPVRVGYTINVQQIFYQQAVDLSQNFLEDLQGEIPEMDDLAYGYNLPYHLSPEGSRVLIVGAGVGNDAAAALRNGMGHIDAVEIDPAILKLGYELHPEHPYDDPRVNTIVDDARSFFENNSTRYDVIAFGLLDSHTLLSSLSSVRLDSFVYTIESFTQVREHLAESGIAVVTFDTSANWIEERLGRMLIEVFYPDQVYAYHGSLGTTFVVGNLMPDQLSGTLLTKWQPDSEVRDLPLPTDDWPYLYLRARKIPGAYWQALLLIGLIALGILFRSFPEALHPDWHFWFLGAAFLLIEFTSITKLALLFGTTWLVNALSISGVLIMILAANLIVLRRQFIPLRLVYLFLFASLILVYIFPLGIINNLSLVPRAIGSILLLSSPLFFSGLIFGESLRRAGETSRPMASNLSGSVFGGVLEYSSLYWGVQSLYVTAAVIYIFSLLSFLRRRR